MPCAICSHTIQNVGAEGQRIFWCPRCGSLTTENGDHRQVEPTMLSRRVRSMEENSILATINDHFVHATDQYNWNEVCESVGIKQRLQ